MPAGKGVKLMDMIAVSWQFWLWVWSSCTEQDLVSNNNSSNNKAELWNYVAVLKEEEILWSTKKMRSWILLNAWHLNERGCRGHKGNSIQLSAWRTIWANYSLCFVKKSVFPYLARECACVCGDICQKHFPKLCKALGRAKKCVRPEWGQESISLSETPAADFVCLRNNSSLIALWATKEQAWDLSLTPD